MNEVKKTEYYRTGDVLTAYVHVTEHSRACAYLGGEKVEARSNLREPFDFRLHMFDFPEKTLREQGGFTIECMMRDKSTMKAEIAFDEAQIIPPEQAYTRAVRDLRIEATEQAGVEPGLRWTIERYRTNAGEPVRVYTVIANPKYVRMVTGTPEAESEFVPGRIQTVAEEAAALEAKGGTVLAATNADFFDMFGDCHPSGLCVRDGRLVANPDSPAPFFGIRKDGTGVIGRLDEIPLSELREAVGCGQIILRDGEVDEIAPLEPFGEVAHPRTAFGLTKHGDLILMVVDGRRPVWSNGASLVDLARLMREHGAVIAANSDGGGSSTVLVRKRNELVMLNHPADLFRPMEDLVRPLFDSVLLVRA